MVFKTLLTNEADVLLRTSASFINQTLFQAYCNKYSFSVLLFLLSYFPYYNTCANTNSSPDKTQQKNYACQYFTVTITRKKVSCKYYYITQKQNTKKEHYIIKFIFQSSLSSKLSIYNSNLILKDNNVFLQCNYIYMYFLKYLWVLYKRSHQC